MTPRALDAATVLKRLQLMRELLATLTTLAPVTVDDLRGDVVKRLAVERALCQLVDTAADINQHFAAVAGFGVLTEYRETFDAAAKVGLITRELAAELKPSAGLRNVLIHEYVNVDLSIVATSVDLARDSYGRYVNAVARRLAEPPAPR